MLSIFKRKNKLNSDSVFSEIQYDMHSHILPGIDDGAQTIEESLALIKCLTQKGISKFICTPHIYKELYPNTKQTITNAYNILLPQVKEQYPEVEIQFAAEYFLDDYFDELLKSEEKLLTVFDNYILVEHSFMQQPIDLYSKIFKIQTSGYKPILAHPERYEYYNNDKSEFQKLIDAGCIFQVNLLSLTGYYGKTSLQIAKYLIENKMVSLVGTDIHHHRHINAYINFNNNNLLNELINQNVLLNKILF